MKIENHKLKSVEGDFDILYQETSNHSNKFATALPDTIVIHYTAGSSLQSSADWLCNHDAQASAHIIVGKKGKIIQLAAFDTITWHAGISQWNERKNLNKFSIGIEIDNAGLLEKRADGYYTHFGEKVKESNVVIAKHKFDQEEKAWEAFTQEQIKVVEKICFILKEQYNIIEIVGHDDIAPERKRDPGPAWPLRKLKETILYGRKDDNSDQITNLSKGIVTADYLNIRSKPSAQSSKVTDPIPKGTKLKILETKGDWSYVKVEIEGWVSKKWLKTF